MDDYRTVEVKMAEKFGVTAKLTRKSIGDFYLDDDSSKPVNVKSNNVEKKNYSPNIISAMKLLKWVRHSKNELYFIFADYKKVDGKIIILNDSGLIPFYHLSWDCLSIEAQGWGVIQMNKARSIGTTQTVEGFFSGMKAEYNRFMDKEAAKMAEIKRLLEEF